MGSYLKQNRIEDKKYLKSFKNRCCCVCYNPNSVAHHILLGTNKGKGFKPSDCYCIPLCVLHHSECHAGERSFYNKYTRVWGDDIIKYSLDIYNGWLTL